MSKLTLNYPLLCLITDPGVPDLLTKAEAAMFAGVNMLQLRGHHLCAAELYKLALALRPLCHRYQALFIVNDRIDVGLAAAADGFQLGTRSLPLAVARQLLGKEYLLGASIHSREEALAAATSGADFLLAGTIFASSTHPGEPPSGTALLHDIKQMLPTYPLLAIGGITSANAWQTMQAGADGIAVISAILNATNVEQAVSELCSAINRKESQEPI
ncbi:MAG: thiamine phosphate synthase [Ktedonobacteraceae bacterium]|nr:thiamine phosphate synthase [Ktedonobacteraceae bacterium]